MQLKLSIIIVNYNTKGLLKNCLRTVMENISVPREVFVVDNASPDNSTDMVAKDFPKVKLIRNKKNLGYNAANNQALREISGQYILLLNPDTLILKEAIEQMIAYLEKHPAVGICGPQIINLAGQIDLSAYPLPNLRDTIEEGVTTYHLPKKFPSFFIHRRKFQSKIDQEKIFEAGWVNGAAFIIRKKVFDLIGPKDENFYAYAEEANWSLKAKLLGYKTIYFPLSQIVHIGSASSNQNWQLKCLRVLSSYRERLYFAQKYFSSASYHFLRIYLFFELWLKLLLRTFFTWQEPKRKEYLKTYNRALDNLIGIENNKNG
jgi:GT2 family glycosyltransferase